MSKRVGKSQKDKFLLSEIERELAAMRGMFGPLIARKITRSVQLLVHKAFSEGMLAGARLAGKAPL